MNKKPSFSPYAHPEDKEEFKRRVEYGLEAQNKFLSFLLHCNVKPFKSDFNCFQEHMPKVVDPEPDFEFEDCFFEIRRQDFVDPVLLGYTKKYDGWKKCAEEKKKTLYFCMFNSDMNSLAFANLSKNKYYVYTRENYVGDLDYCISLKFFKVFPFIVGMEKIVRMLGGDPFISCGDLELNGMEDWM